MPHAEVSSEAQAMLAASQAVMAKATKKFADAERLLLQHRAGRERAAADASAAEAAWQAAAIDRKAAAADCAAFEAARIQLLVLKVEFAELERELADLQDWCDEITKIPDWPA